jgi:hypothetical protein
MSFISGFDKNIIDLELWNEINLLTVIGFVDDDGDKVIISNIEFN